jgi:hypothetical protein
VLPFLYPRGFIVRNNEGYGAGAGRGRTCIISGGEVRDNKKFGVITFGSLTMQNGLLNNDDVGLFVTPDGAVTMTGGTIIKNDAAYI